MLDRTRKSALATETSLGMGKEAAMRVWNGQMLDRTILSRQL